MAETWTYEVYWNENMNKQLPDYESVSVYIKRVGDTSKNGSDYRIVSGSKINSNVNIKTWNSGKLVFGDYGTTGTLSQNTEAHTITSIDFNPTSDILNIGSSSTLSYITRNSGSNQTIFIFGGDGGAKVFTIYVKVEYKYGASTVSGGSTIFGQNSSVTINGANDYASELTHNVKWTISGNGHQYTATASKSGVGTVSALMDSSWMDAVPTGTSISCSLEIKSYKGSTLIGTNTGSCTITVPSSVKPTIGSITCSIKDENQGIPQTYIQNTTGVYIQINSPAPGEGTTIKEYLISANVTETYTYDSVNARYIVDRLANGGEITFTLSVVDRRNRRSDPVTATINVMEYALPSITVASAYRCRLSGIADDIGTYACIRIVANYSQTGGNTMTINSTYYQSDIPSQEYTAQSNMESGVSYIIGNDNLNPLSAYFIRFRITDSLGNIIVRDVRVQTSAFAIHIKNGGTGVAVGKTSEIANSFEINPGWDMYYKGISDPQPAFIYYEPTQSQPEPDNPFVGMVWLKPKSSS